MRIEIYAIRKDLTIGEAFVDCWKRFTDNHKPTGDDLKRIIKDYQAWRDERQVPEYVKAILEHDEKLEITTNARASPDVWFGN